MKTCPKYRYLRQNEKIEAGDKQWLDWTWKRVKPDMVGKIKKEVFSYRVRIRRAIRPGMKTCTENDMTNGLDHFEEEFDDPEMTCPKCGNETPDLDGFGFIGRCKKCGYCTHPAHKKDDTGEWVCEICGEKEIKCGIDRT